MYSDLPVIVSEDYCGFLEPQEHIWRSESGKGYYLKSLLANCPETLAPYKGICGFSESFHGKTLLRFPLRNQPSKLSDEVYTISKLQVLLESLKAEAKYTLLFLRSVCSIEVIEISVYNTFKSVFKVSIDTDTYIQHKHKLLSDVQSTFIIDSLSSVRKVIKSCNHFSIEIHDDSTHSKHEWIVVNQVGSEDTEVMQLAEKQHVLPWIGTAFEVSTTPCYGGRIFCVLPLPIEDRAPFSVHINGTFAVSSNRRSLKWEAQERKDDEESTWNKLLVQKCLPSCYVHLVLQLIQLYPSNYTAIYGCWPDIDHVKCTTWQSMLKPFYMLLLHSNQVVYTPITGGQWISISESIFVDKNEVVPQPVKECILNCHINLVEVDHKQWIALQYYKCTHSINILTPSKVRTALKKHSGSYEYMTKEAKFNVLDYCLSDNKYNDLSGLKLLPLLNGDFVQFIQATNFSYGTTKTYICSSSTPHTLLPGLEHILVSVYSDNPITHLNLTKVANSGQTQLKVLGISEVAKLLPLCNPQSWPNEQLDIFWQWLRDKELRFFHQQQIIPIKHSSGSTIVMPLAKQGGVVYISLYSSTSSMLVVALEKCGIKLANAQCFPYLTHRQLTQYLYQFNPDDILDAMQGFNLGNVKLSSKEVETLQTFLSSSTLSTVARINTVCKLSIFSVIQDTENHYSINSIKTQYCGNKAIAEIESFDLRKDLLSNTPLVISRYGNELNLLKQLSKHIRFMNEVEYLLQISFNQIQKREFNSSNVVPFMRSILDSFDRMRRKYPSLFEQFKNAISTLSFIPVSSSIILKAPCNLFDPQDAMLKQLFSNEPVFPGPEFSSYFYTLRQCGLKSITSITGTDILQIITSVHVYSETGIATSNDVSISRIKAVFSYLSKYPNVLNERVISTSFPPRHGTLQNTLILQAQSYCLLPIVTNSPQDYPTCLMWKGSSFHQGLASSKYNQLVVLSQSISSSQLPMIIGSQAIFIENVPLQIARSFGSSSQIFVDAVVAHFKEIINNEDEIESAVLDQLSYQTYSYLQDNVDYCDKKTFNDIENWIWIESESTFISSSMVAIKSNPTFRQSLEPFVFVAQSRLQKFYQFFSKCGIQPQITTNHILSVLQSIKDRPGQISTEEAWSLVKAILDWVVDDTSRMNDGDILVPVQCDSQYPQLLPVKDVAYTDNEMLLNIAMTSNEEYILVHDKVAHLAKQLGLSPLSDHLDITEDVFKDAGQHEPLVTRLSNILKEYKDGLTIIKEMIQNADDAKATEVNILYDARQHTTEKLLFKGMGDSHGPALIVHNNSNFTNEDFENITKLAGATKAKKPLKIGKFGVGFCSVYHITDVPSFVSGEWLYIFDPTLQYLKGIVCNENRPGKKVKYRSKFVSQSQQLVPYEDLFGFKSSTVYNGTMFRFPFRRSPSQISSTLYNKHMISQLRKDLNENGSKLLLFLQHVKRITFSSIYNHSNEPNLEVSIEMRSSSSHGVFNKCITTKYLEQNNVVEYWLVSNHKEELLIQDHETQPSIASVACQLIKVNESNSFECKQIEGSVFCFLPLAVPSTGLPVHVSANFAVMSNRSGIWTGSSRIATDSREWWNQKLMETTIPKAYCSLLTTLQVMCTSGQLLNYEFYSLWPLNTSLQSRHPWESMNSVLYKMISENALFHSASTNMWLTLAESKFISPGIFNKSTLEDVDILSCINEAVYILQISVVFLPNLYMQELQQQSVEMINEEKFADIFFLNIHSFDSYVDVRNEVLSHILITIAIEQTQSKQSSMTHLIQKYPCVPVSPEGKKLKLASEVVDQLTFGSLFDSEDEMFPIPAFNNNSLIRQAMHDLGLISSNLPWNIIIKSAKTIDALFARDTFKALNRVKLIFKSVEEKNHSIPSSQSMNDPAIDTLKNIHFLPIVSKPDHYILPWKGEQCDLLSPSQVISMNISKATALVGSQKAIVNTNDVSNGGCGHIPYSVLTVLGIPTRPSLDDVLLHFQCLLDTFQPIMCQNYKVVDEISRLCRNIYEFFDDEIKFEKIQTESTVARFGITQHFSSCAEVPSILANVEIKLMEFKTKPFIWTGTCFASPHNVAKYWKKNGPYLYNLPNILSERKYLLGALDIKSDFKVQKLLETFQFMLDESETTLSSAEWRELVDCIILELNSASEEATELDEVILVDKNYILRPAKELSFNDAPWLPPAEDCNYVHSKLIREKALVFGVKPIRSKFLETFISPLSQQFGGSKFGQKEKLTQRIKNILQDYPLDVTFLKELLQNADDAKATKMCVILDKRTHGQDRLPSQEWGELQGPALLVWNDSDFTNKDLEDIQKLGLGSKRGDTESIGQFGIGFNVVYHVTDCPSFITKGNILCVFDPHCRYVPGADPLHPGRRYDNLDSTFWNNMSDLQTAYLQNNLPNHPSYLNGGSLFRFPLRSTKEQIMKSDIVENKISTEPLTASIMEKKLNKWVPQIEDALLFLNHITQFEFYIISNEHKSSFKLITSYNVSMNDHALVSRSDYQSHLSQFKESYEPHVVTYQLTLSSKIDKSMVELSPSSHDPFIQTKNEWLIQQGVGDLNNNKQNWEFIKQVLPKHGIAVPLKHSTSFHSKVFCFLPLPIESNLPVHINGQFVLGTNRRSLWNSDNEDSKTRWNNALIEAIASSYVYFLNEVRNHIVKIEGYRCPQLFYKAVNWYYSLFPYWMALKSSESLVSRHERESMITGLSSTWLTLAKLVFLNLWTKNIAVLISEVYTSDEKGRVIRGEWYYLHNDNDPFHQAYFHPRDKDIRPVLRKLGMILTCAPNDLYKHFKKFKPLIAKHEQVFNFYSKFHSQILSKGCPSFIKDTPFESIETFIIFLQYLLENPKKVKDKLVYEFPSSPFTYPLLLTADGYLRQFEEANKVICSEFTKLFANSLSRFLHPALLTLNMSTSYFATINNIDFHKVNEILMENLSSQLNDPQVDNTKWCILSKDDLKMMWNCITNDPIFGRYKIYILNNWAFLPATNQYLYCANSPIIPMRMSSSDDVTYQLLTRLSIPFLDKTVHEDAKQFCPELTNYDKVLAILYMKHSQESVLTKINLSISDIDTLMKYLSRTNFRHNPIIMKQIKSLPIFQTANGVLTTLLGKNVYLWPSESFCIAGYEKWALVTNVIFLKKHDSWTYLCGSDFTLLGTIEDEKRIYSLLIFPCFSKLTHHERKQHLEYIRDYLFEDVKHDAKRKNKKGSQASQFIAEIKSLKCLPASSNSNELLTVSSFCDHNVEIFTTFPKYFLFLDDEYQGNSWLPFLRDLGLRTTVTFEEFVDFANSLSNSKLKTLEKIADVLLDYLFSKEAKEWHKTPYYLSQIGDICFVKVAKLNAFTWIKAACQPPQSFSHLDIGLTKLNQAVVYDCASLVWTVKPVVSLPELTTFIDENNSLEQLGIVTSPSVNDVHQNLINISNSGLSNFQLFSTYNPDYVLTNDNDRADLVDIIIDNIEYLEKHKAINILQQLTRTTCIPVSAEPLSEGNNVITRPVLVKPIQVVQRLSSSDAKDFAPYIHSLPCCLNRLRDTLEIMGVCNNLELIHIQFVLEMMYSSFKGGIKLPNDIALVRNLIYKLADLLPHDTNHDEKMRASQQLQPLYLPVQIDTHSWKLIESSCVLFVDSSRFKNKEVKMFNLTDTSYGMFKIPPGIPQTTNSTLAHTTSINILHEKDVCLRLPKEVRPKGLSLHCIEQIIICNQSDQDSPLSTHLIKLKQVLPKFIDAIPQYLSIAVPFLQEQATVFSHTLFKIFKEMEIVVISGLQVKVILCKEQVCIGTISVDYSLQNENTKYTMYVNDKSTPRPSLWKEVAQSLCIEVGRMLNINPLTFFGFRQTLASDFLVVQSTEDLQSLAIAVQDHDDEFNDDHVPQIGQPIPPKLIEMLDSDINHIYRPQELIGYEVEENYLVWAIVLYPVQLLHSDDNSIDPLMKKYVIAYNQQDEEGKEVSALDIYKFVVKDSEVEGEGTELVPINSATATLQQANDSKRLKDLKRTICKELLLIWKLTTIEEKKKAIRRMYIKYHPDKINPMDKDLFEEAFKFMLRQIDRLEAGLQLEQPDNELPHDDELIYKQSSWQRYYAAWDNNIHRTTTTSSGGGVGRSFGGNVSGSSINWNTYLRPIPDQVEAERWLRQASSDLEAMNVLRNEVHHKSISCQVMFMAHEAAEKALKAGMYALIGINSNSESLKTHNLKSHAQAISSENPSQLAALPDLATSMEPFYLETRFPNRYPCPTAPVDIYKPDQATVAADFADKIFVLIDKIVKKQL